MTPDNTQSFPVESSAYDVSVVVPTYNRESLLRRTIETLLHQHVGAVRYEILVVDNDSRDGTRAVVEGYAARCPDLRYLFEPRRGVSHARNTGTAAARAPIVAFIDDDVEAAPTWIATIKDTFDTRPEIDCIGGKIEPRWAVRPPAWLTSMFWGPLALQADKADTPYIDADNAVACLMTANFACRRQALVEVRGFSPDFLRDEDRELQLRLWGAGKRGMYVGGLVVTTEVPPERLTKAYHRQFYTRAGASHARMRYLDRIDRNGRLVGEAPRSRTLFGTPGFVYSSLLFHTTQFIWRAVTLNWNRAFFHQTRVLYFANYVRARRIQARVSLWTAPRELFRFARAVFRNRMASRVSGSQSPPRSAQT